jgi:hypothetical protein
LVLGQTMGNRNTQDSPRPGLGGSHHLSPYSILCTSPRDPHPNGFLFRGSQVGVPKSPKLGFPRLWSPITLRADLGSRCGLKKSCSPRWELSKGMLHAICRQVDRVDSQLFLVRSQTDNSTPGPYFDHNLCFRCPNEQCELILNMYVPRAFQWYKKHHKTFSFDPWNRSLKFWESTGLPSPKVGVALGVWGFTPSHFLRLPGVCDVTLGISLGPHPYKPFALVVSPKLGLQQIWCYLLIHVGVFQLLRPVFSPFPPSMRLP